MTREKRRLHLPTAAPHPVFLKDLTCCHTVLLLILLQPHHPLPPPLPLGNPAVPPTYHVPLSPPHLWRPGLGSLVLPSVTSALYGH